MADPITFDQIPYDWLEPGTFMEIRPHYGRIGLLPWPARMVVIAQKLSTGTLADATLREIVDPEEGVALLGDGSIGVEQLRAVRAVNRTQPLFVIALPDADGAVKASGTFTFTGTVSKDIVLRFLVNDVQVRMTAEAGDTVSELATKLAAAINAPGNIALPLTATSDAGVVTVICRHGGEVGNEIDLRVDARQPLPDGLNVAIVAMAGGSGNPDVQDAFDAIPNQWFTDITMPWSDATNMATLAAELLARYDAMSKLDAHGYVAKRGTYGEAGTFGNLTNSPHLSPFVLNKSPTPSWTVAASMMGLASFHLTNDPARQLRSLAVSTITAPDDGDQFDDTERELLLRKGVSSFTHLDDGTTVISRVITSYKVSNLAAADRAWLDIMVPKTASRIRFDWSIYVTLLYPRSKLVEDEATAAYLERPPGETSGDDQSESNAIVTPRRMHASWAGRCRLYARKVWISDVERTVRESRFEIDDADKNRMNAQQRINIVGNLMVLAGALEFEA